MLKNASYIAGGAFLGALIGSQNLIKALDVLVFVFFLVLLIDIIFIPDD